MSHTLFAFPGSPRHDDPVTVETVVWGLTGLAVLDLVLTRLRLSGRVDRSGRARIPQKAVNAHSLTGLLAVLVWVAYLRVLGGPLNLFVGIVALVLWWVTAGVGLMILSRWLPGRGRHAAASEGDTWSRGPWLSLLAHGGLVLGVAFFTWGTLWDTI